MTISKLQLWCEGRFRHSASPESIVTYKISRCGRKLLARLRAHAKP